MRAPRAAVLLEKDATVSTNDDARELALADAPHGALVLARSQTGGRGRAGRGFLSPEGGLYMSVVLRPAAPPHHWSVLPLVAGAAAACALRERGFPAELKWPNDLMLGAKKLGGVLVESRMGASPFAIVGIGLNLTAAPTGIADATALAMHGHAPEARALALSIRAALVARMARLDSDGPRAVMPQVRALCGTLGRRVEWDKQDGTAADIADDGALVIETTAGEHVRVLAGDVKLRTR